MASTPWHDAHRVRKSSRPCWTDNESSTSGLTLWRSAAGIAKSRTDRAATVSNVEGVEVARNPRHFSKPAQSVPTNIKARKRQ